MSLTWPIAIVRYGRVPEVARFGLPEGMTVSRGDLVVIASPRGEIVGEVLEQLRRSPEPGVEQPDTTGAVARFASDADLETNRQNSDAAASAYADWLQRITDWEIDVELLDIEFTLDKRTTLYVLNGRDAEPTKLALRAVTEHLGLVDVQPVTADGVVPPQGGGGCGTCG